MKAVTLAHEADWAGWRTAARGLVGEGVRPDQVVWSVGASDDLFAEPAPPAASAGGFSVPRPFVELAETVSMAREPARWGLLYQLLWRITREGERHLVEDAADAQMVRARALAQSVRRDIHKMRAFVRFREVAEPEGVRHVAWFEPDHHIVVANAPFFVRRFASMVWSILTPECSVHWNGEALLVGAGATRAEIPSEDRLEAYWRTYFSAIFNPARLKVSAMLSEMPRKYWRNLPEAAAIPQMIQQAQSRTDAMIAEPARPARVARAPAARAAPVAEGEMGAMAVEAAACRACPLWEPATQTVFGEGPQAARLMLVGEQPGDQEDLAGRPFVGPAGQMLDRALMEAGIDRAGLYVTNAVKHFKFTLRGKRRLHEKPNNDDIAACNFWLRRETAAVRPALTVALGATAARALLGRTVTISRERGAPIRLENGQTVFVTVHPSYLLRLPDEAAKAREYAAFVADLREAGKLAA